MGNIVDKSFILKDMIAENIPWYHRNKKDRIIGEQKVYSSKLKVFIIV
jgi:homogentisate 1,2-dioxygenase